MFKFKRRHAGVSVQHRCATPTGDIPQQRMTRDKHLSRRRHVLTRHKPQHRRFAGAIRAEEPKGLLRSDAETQVVKRHLSCSGELPTQVDRDDGVVRGWVAAAVE
jgi:hypothetical protein